MSSLPDLVYLLQFSPSQLLFTLLVFVWSGFVRSGLGFGGAALGLPLMLLIDNSPLFWLPVIGLHLLFFTSLTLRKRLHNVDWGYLRSSLKWIFPGKIVGVLGLLNLPKRWLVIIIYGITLFYAILWLLRKSIRSKSGWTDKLILLIGGYVSGTSLTGAPLIVAVYMQHVEIKRLRDSLFVLWFILVMIKMGTFAAFSVDLHLLSSLLLIPVVWIGHVLGLRAHDHLMANDALFKRILGGVLAVICLLGFSQAL
jgi:uncharacterized membrane protein YfcA